MFSPVMQKVIRSVVSHAVELVNEMNHDEGEYTNTYGFYDIYENARQLLNMEIDPTNTGVFDTTAMLENAIRFVIMDSVEFRFRD